MAVSRAHRAIKKYVVVDEWEVATYSYKGYEPVGGVAFDDDGKPYQAMALYEDVLYSDEVTSS